MGDAKAEALRLKSMSEKKYPTSLKSALKYAKRAHRLCPDLDGISQMLTTFRVLREHRKSDFHNWYKILQLDPFCHPTTISRQYKKLALLLHPDKNPSPGSDEAFKTIGLAFLTLSDKIRRKQFDVSLRVNLQSQAQAAAPDDTFWTACSTCRVLHEFDRRYLSQRLMCPSCKKTFSAVEGSSTHSGSIRDGNDNGKRAANSSLVKSKKKPSRYKLKLISSTEKSSVTTASGRQRRSRSRKLDDDDDDDDDDSVANEMDNVDSDNDDDDDRLINWIPQDKKKRNTQKREVADSEKSGSQKVESRHQLVDLVPLEKRGTRQKRMAIELEKSDSQKVENPGEETLAQIQFEVKRKPKIKKEKKEKKEKEKAPVTECTDLVSMSVEDADFYDFDRDRIERSFNKGQVWAVYDDDDGMPRHYGLVEDVVSVNPFLLKMSWLDFQNSGDEALICWEKSGFHVSCGRFKVGKKVDIHSVNFFSHLVECERAAREIYRIYPKKGSVWALYSEVSLNGETRSSTFTDRRCYDIVVFLTSYSEMHGLSLAYLEKVEGFKTIFTRREIGCHAIRWLEKDDVRLFSHQIPARKLSGEEASGLPKDCWELDPASLPSDLLRIG